MRACYDPFVRMQCPNAQSVCVQIAVMPSKSGIKGEAWRERQINVERGGGGGLVCVTVLQCEVSGA